jgi:hypothetical protein
MVELRFVAPHEGPLLVAALRRQGIQANGYEVESPMRYRKPGFMVCVPYRDVEAAQALLD